MLTGDDLRMLASETTTLAGELDAEARQREAGDDATRAFELAFEIHEKTRSILNGLLNNTVAERAAT